MQNLNARDLHTQRGGVQGMSSEARQRCLGQVHSWPRSSSLGSRACQGSKGAPQASSWHSAPNYDSKIISFNSVRKEHIKARNLWIKMLTNQANYSSVIWIFTQWARVLMKAFSWAGGFDDEAAIYVPDPVLLILARESSLECLLLTENPDGFCPRFFESWSKLNWSRDYEDVGRKIPLPGERSNQCVRMSWWDSFHFQFYSRFKNT